MPIYYNEELKGWKFDKLTPKEQEVMERTAEELMMQMFTSNLLQYAVGKVQEMKDDPESIKDYLEGVDPRKLHEA